ncbi:MAG: tyrosine-protein phosphatase [Acidimicrobiia bacterium]
MTDAEGSTLSYVNFRDLGGHATRSGVVRSGRVFRSDSLAHCTPDDVEHLVRARGVRTVVDLRRDLEVERAPVESLRAAGVRVEHRSLIDPAVPALTTHDVEGTLAERYVAILSSSGAQFVSVVQLIADDANHPLVFQCAAGKDRTGLVAALVLETLGVDDEDIVADYARTAAAIDILLARIAAANPEREPPGPTIMSAEASTMEATLDWLRATHGGAEEYLFSHGLTAEETATMRANLVEPA